MIQILAIAQGKQNLMVSVHSNRSWISLLKLSKSTTNENYFKELVNIQHSSKKFATLSYKSTKFAKFSLNQFFFSTISISFLLRFSKMKKKSSFVKREAKFSINKFSPVCNRNEGVQNINFSHHLGRDLNAGTWK